MAPRTNHPSLPPPPQPTRILFDPYNSSATGHQTAPSRLAGTLSWRQSRSRKLEHQFRDVTGAGGAKHLSDLVGAGSENWRKDGRKDNGDWEVGAPGLREQGWQDIRGLLGHKRKRSGDSSAAVTGSKGGSGKQSEDRRHVPSSSSSKRMCLDNSYSYSLSQSARRKITTSLPVKADTVNATEAIAALENEHGYVHEHEHNPGRKGDADDADHENKTLTPPNNNHDNNNDNDDSLTPPPPQIFRGLNIYLNGSTAPLISDHKLKQLFTRHGGNTSISLGRRSVTHVILGEKCGGGLASGKIQKENTTVRGKGIKFVTAQWVIDSIERGIRQPEGRYAAQEVRGRLGGSGQRSALVMFSGHVGQGGDAG